MKDALHKILPILVLLSLIVLAYGFIKNKGEVLNVTPVNYKQERAYVGRAGLSVETVKTDEEKTLGLGGRQSIGERDGMLFLYNRTEPHGIWMKNMLFAIDIIWLDIDGKVIDIEKNVSPDSYPKVFYPDTPARGVLEVRAGFTDDYEVKVGDAFGFVE